MYNNIEQAMITAHQCASNLQEVGLQYAWLARLDPGLTKNQRRSDNEKILLKYFLEDGNDTLLRQSALVQEIALMRLAMEKAHNLRSAYVKKLPPSEITSRDGEMLKHTNPEELINAARERVAASYSAMKELLDPSTPSTLKP